MTDNKLRMDAYYYGFDETGQPDIDLILSAVACAGKSFHHTDQWNDEDSPWPGHSGNSPIEWIANAALSAAQEMARLKSENEALRKHIQEGIGLMPLGTAKRAAWVVGALGSTPMDKEAQS
ncbi:hypothetical protein [Pseudomonas asiatica]|uniref:hypothetical protein n=1 Tax=Pseudomonas asiatica TaxID=2219225 RepID=UPI003C6E6D75